MIKLDHSDLRVRALYDIWAFADLISFKGGAKSFYEIHREMAEINCAQQIHSEPKREYRRRMFLVPREHLKTTVNTVLYCMWRIYRNPDVRGILGTNIKDTSTDFIREVRAYFEDAELIETVWNNRPHIKGPLIPKLKTASSNYKRANYEVTEATDSKVIWTSWAIQVIRRIKDKQPTLQALSVGMKPTSKHCDFIVLDDVVDLTNSDSHIKAQKVRTWAHDLENVVTKKPVYYEICPGFHEWLGNEILINGTRYHAWDYYSHFVGNTPEEFKARTKKTGYTVYQRSVYKNGVDNSDGYICPQLFDEEVEKDLLDRESLSTAMFFAQYCNKIVSSEDAIFTTADIRAVFPDHYRNSVYNLAKYCDHAQMTDNGPIVYPISLIGTIDLAASVSARADKSGITIGGTDSERRVHIVKQSAGRWKTSEHFKNIHEACMQWGVRLLYYEGGSGYQDTFEQSFREWCMNRKLQPLTLMRLVQSRSMSKVERIKYTIQPLIQSGLLYVSQGVLNAGHLKREVELFNPNSNENEDDCLDMIEMLARMSSPTHRSVGTESRQVYGRHIELNTRYGGTR